MPMRPFEGKSRFHFVSSGNLLLSSDFYVGIREPLVSENLEQPLDIGGFYVLLRRIGHKTTRMWYVSC